MLILSIDNIKTTNKKPSNEIMEKVKYSVPIILLLSYVSYNFLLAMEN